MAALSFRQMVCNLFSPGGVHATPGDNAWVVVYLLWMCVVYKALGDTLRMGFAGAFLELCLGIKSIDS